MLNSGSSTYVCLFGGVDICRKGGVGVEEARSDHDGPARYARGRVERVERVERDGGRERTRISS